MMGSSKQLSLIIFFIFLKHYYILIEGVRYIDMDREMRAFNKPPIKTFKNEIGEIFDCVDINKQPAFDHPLLKNHIIQRRPSSHSNMIVHEATSSSSSSSVEPSKTLLKKWDCPDGTVPIRRSSEEDLRRAKSFSEVESTNVHQQSIEEPVEGQFLSIAKTRKDSGISYYGIQARISTYNPAVAENQSSTAQFWIENGPKEELNSLQAGWIVAPQLFGDSRTRLFGYWQVDGPERKACYNTLCPGFVQIDKDHPIGEIITPISEYEGALYDIKISIYQDTESGNWWLTITSKDIHVGYWPKEILPHLSDGSSLFSWGGLSEGTPTAAPAMGSGHFPDGNFHHQCYMRQMKVVAQSRNWEDPNRHIIDTYTLNKNCFFLLYYGQVDKTDYQHTVAFGGPGGNCQL